jgi:hypothetical protein
MAKKFVGEGRIFGQIERGVPTDIEPSLPLGGSSCRCLEKPTSDTSLTYLYVYLLIICEFKQDEIVVFILGFYLTKARQKSEILFNKFVKML